MASSPSSTEPMLSTPRCAERLESFPAVFADEGLVPHNFAAVDDGAPLDADILLLQTRAVLGMQQIEADFSLDTVAVNRSTGIATMAKEMVRDAMDRAAIGFTPALVRGCQIGATQCEREYRAPVRAPKRPVFRFFWQFLPLVNMCCAAAYCGGSNSPGRSLHP
jgi:hypothetical protein